MSRAPRIPRAREPIDLPFYPYWTPENVNGFFPYWQRIPRPFIPGQYVWVPEGPVRPIGLRSSHPLYRPPVQTQQHPVHPIGLRPSHPLYRPPAQTPQRPVVPSFSPRARGSNTRNFINERPNGPRINAPPPLAQPEARSPSPFIPPLPDDMSEEFDDDDYDFQIERTPSPVPTRRFIHRPPTPMPRARRLYREDSLTRPVHDTRTSVSASEQTLECPICFSDVEGPVRVAQCRHVFCGDCIINYVNSQLDSPARGSIECPTCVEERSRSPAVLDVDFMRSIGISETQLERFDLRVLKDLAEKVSCPSCHHEFWVSNESLEDPTIRVIDCFTCNESFCKDCKRGMRRHRKGVCPPDGTKELNKLMRRRGWATCPVCGVPTEKQEGCNHITCTSKECRGQTHWCYLCRGTIADLKETPGVDVSLAVYLHSESCSG